MGFRKQIVRLLLHGNPRALWKRYLVAVSLVVVLLLGAHIYQRSEVENIAEYAELVNVAGRQEVLSQQILSLASEYFLTAAPDINAQLTHTIDLFEKSHDWILSSPALARLDLPTYEDDGLTNLLSRRFVALGRDILEVGSRGSRANAALREVRRLGRYELLAALGAGKKTFERSAEKVANQVRRTQDNALYAALAILVLEAVTIFLPAQRTVTRTLDRLDKRHAAMTETYNKLNDYAGKLEVSALRDPLTGLWNRAHLMDKLKQLLERHTDSARPICVMHLDLDRFKQVNDTMGHAVGDAVLLRVAEIIRGQVGPDDLAARVGGDEFVLVMRLRQGDGSEAAQARADSLVEQLHAPIAALENEVLIGGSIGFTFARPGEIDPDKLISDADTALYAAKRSGRGFAQRFTRTMRQGLEERATLIADIERAFDGGEFVPYLQPEVSMTTGEVIGFEVLARWDHPTRGVLLPSNFIEIAEEIGAIDAIDTRVMLEGLSTLAELRRDGWTAPQLAVNVATRTLRQADFAERLLLAVEAYGLGPTDVVLELREASLIEDADKVGDILSQLQAARFPLRVDEFGSGHASLGALWRLKTNSVKIDRSLVARARDPDVNQLIKGIVGVSEAMGLAVIAAGVENMAQYDAIRRLGVHGAQGFGIANPMSAAKLREWLGSHGQRPPISVSEM